MSTKKLKKSLFIGCIALLIWAAGYGLFIASILFSAPQKPETKTEALVVFTGGDNRIETGLQLLTAGLSKNLFISGVHPDVSMQRIRKKWKAIDGRLPKCCIALGYKAETTYQNAYETRDWVLENDYKSVRLVTADYHMNRSLIELKHALPENIEILAHPIKQSNIRPKDTYFWHVTFIEYHKTLMRFLAMALGGKPEHITEHNHENHHNHDTNA